MLERWQQLAPRERLLVVICGAFIVFAVFWSLVVQPIYKGSARLAAEVESKQTQLVKYQELASRLGASGSSTASATSINSTDSIVVIIDKTTRQNALAAYLKANQPEGDAQVRLRFEDAPFDVLVTWLGELSQQYGMVAMSANFDVASPGRVNCSLILSRGAF